MVKGLVAGRGTMEYEHAIKNANWIDEENSNQLN
jgi:hypothetical protein